jgi:hypothetical protein
MRQSYFFVLGFVLGACGKGTRAPSLKAEWVPALEAAARVVAEGDLAVAERQTTGPAPAPNELEAVRLSDGQSAGKDRGWVLRGAADVGQVLVIDEGAALEYVVRRFGAGGGTPLPTPDGKTWVLRAAVCAPGAELCALVRWTPKSVQPVERGGLEKLAITVIRASTLAVERQIVLELADLYSGGAGVGAIAVNPTRPVLYVLERALAGLAVQAVDLEQGTVAWRTLVDRAPLAPREEAEVVPTGDGAHLVVARGTVRWGETRLAGVHVLDAASGAARAIEPGWPAASFETIPGRPELLVRRVAVVDDGGETPERRLEELTLFDPATGKARRGWAPPKDQATRIPGGTIPLGGDRVILTPPRDERPFAADPTPAEQQTRRAAAVSLLLGR